MKTLVRRRRGPAWGPLPLVFALAAGCGGDDEPAPEPLRIAVVMPLQEGASELPNFEWALEAVNAAGGAAGRPLVLDYYDPNTQDLDALADELAADDEHVAVIGPAGSAALAQVADRFVAADKPLVSTTSTSDDLLRAYGGKGAIWRTRESDIAQTELLVRHARAGGAKKIALLTSLDVSGYTFFAWFGFFARELGFADEDVAIVTFASEEPCNDRVMEALAGAPDFLFVAPGSPIEMECVARSLPPSGQPRPRIVFADTGLDPYALADLGELAGGLEGFVGAGDEAYEAAFTARFPGERLPPHGPSEYDAVLLLAYGLERSGGRGGVALIDGIKEAVDGDEALAGAGPDADGDAATLAALREGLLQALAGASGPLRFEPDLYMDLASSTLAHYVIGEDGLALDERFSTADPTFLTSQGAFVRPSAAPPDTEQSSWTPAMPKTDTWAVIAALSTGFSNYRHQADALQHYRFLREMGIDDDHIVLILADDLADNPDNDVPGEVRNLPGGEDLRAGAVIDYQLGIGAEDLDRILRGEVSETTPTVISPGPGSDVLVYLAGHGGAEGIPIGALTPEDGLNGGDEVFSPDQLRLGLCALAAEQRYRRALVVVESCYSGVFGEAASDGIEYGCGDVEGEVPLEGVALLTAANSREVSYAGAYDDAVPAWVNDAFSRALADNLAPGRSLADVFADAYRSTAGSHPSAFNLAHAGRLSEVQIDELFAP
ncbi:MAG: ABC transporter substrate-binding protein [Myxococcales bacterium]|nr:ABC transporter substrate-binding protein [Myxococcales bacterium]